MSYDPDDCLMISGLQHFHFCKRQWALIHIEQQWAENLRTVEGNILHERAHDEQFTESRGDLFITRGLRVFSLRLGLSGECDVVEFIRDDSGISLHGREGSWRPYPVEYKRGQPKEDSCDELQLCAQAMCLEEMLVCTIDEGALFYGEIRRRSKVQLTDDMKERVREMYREMHKYMRDGYIPRVKPTKSCNACSLKNICMQKLYKLQDVKKYMKENLE